LFRQLIIGIKIFKLKRLRKKTFFILLELLTIQVLPLLLLSRANPAGIART
jgi:hypothetical protein